MEMAHFYVSENERICRQLQNFAIDGKIYCLHHEK